MKLKAPACWQLAAATLVALVLIVAQALDVLAQVDDGLANAKQLAMLLQIRGAIWANSPAFWTIQGYVLLFVGVHLAITLCAVAVFRSAARLLGSLRIDSVRWSTAFVLAVSACSILWNRRLYPQSMAFPNSDLLLVQAASPFLFWGLTALVIAAVAMALLSLLRNRPKSTLAALVLSGCVLLPSCVPPRTLARNAVGDNQPDVIVIGVDSLRPDFLSRNGFPSPMLTPRINATLADMAVFDDALTPMARTFVAYMSILTGKEPLNHGARFNLYPRERFDRSASVAWRFREAGYHSVFAMDEARFANVDGSFGFDEVVTPPPGVLDFAIGSAFDSVGTNLLLQLPGIGEQLRYVYGNRAAYRLYQDNDHSERLRAAVARVPADKPLLLFSHFCLPHWPYLRYEAQDGEPMPAMRLTGPYADAPADYMRALHATDRQVGSLLDELRAAGRLRNAVVVLLSDHGEGLGMRRDEFSMTNSGHDGLVMSLAAAQYGHGGYVLAEGQYRVLLAMQRYADGKPVWPSRTVAGPSSLLDVAPTLVAAAGVTTTSKFDGLSLVPALKDAGRVLPERVRFVESGERAAAVERADIDEHEVAAEMSYLYSLTPDLRFEIDPALLDGALAEKQRGAWLGSYGVVAKPAGYVGDVAVACWQGMDFAARTMSCIPYPAREPHYRRLQDEVCAHYAGDGEFASRWCVGRSGQSGVATH